MVGQGQPSKTVFPYCRVSNNATQSIPDTTKTAILFNTEDFDPFNMHSTISNTSRITVAEDGIYLIGGVCNFASNGVGYRSLAFDVNGALEAAVQQEENPGAAVVTFLEGSYLVELSSGDYVEMMVQQTSGAGLNLSANPRFYVTKISDLKV